MNKQQVAFMWSAERLRDTTGHLYFWTFTFKETYDLWQYGGMWKTFTKALEHLATEPGLYGMRVCQLHPGGHGLHYHCLINQWIDARQVWQLCRRMGMGCNAVKVKQGSWRGAVKYLCKYLTRETEPFPINMRRVGSMWGFPMYAVNDIYQEHPARDSVLYLIRFWGRGSIGSGVIHAAYNSPNCRGDYRTLIVAVDYAENRRMGSFTWTEQKMEDSLKMYPYRDWVNYGDTIYQPSWMPALLGEQPF
jgi:hypothetical protein